MGGSRYILVGPGGVQFEVDFNGISIGRNRQNSVVLREKRISRFHADVFVSQGNVVVRDRSTLGTFVNGQRVSGQMVLNIGDTIAIGSSNFRVEIFAPSQTPAVAPTSQSSFVACPSCGQNNPAGTRLCQFCGNTMTHTAQIQFTQQSGQPLWLQATARVLFGGIFSYFVVRIGIWFLRGWFGSY